MKNRIKKIFKAVFGTMKEMCALIGYCIESNLYAIALVLEFICPYVMYFLCKAHYIEHGNFNLGFLGLTFPIAIIILSATLKSISNKNGNGLSMPIPNKRFTEVNRETGEVTMDTDKLQELLIYIADLEDWLERTGRSKSGEDKRRI